MTATFLSLILAAIAVALLSGRGHRHPPAAEFFVASGQFGTILFFFLSVGETYSVATMLGFAGGVVVHGTSFVQWFVGYILLAFPVSYFLSPWIWRAGQRHGAITLPDLFRRHYDSRALELVVTLSSIAFLIPLGVIQFLGLQTVLLGLGWQLAPFVLAILAASLAFLFVGISGIRAPAYVSVLKDVLMLVAIGLTGFAAFTVLARNHGSVPPAAATVLTRPSGRENIFAMSTILLQAIGFCVVPQTVAAVFTARSVQTLRRALVPMPLYMGLFPLLLMVALLALRHPLADAHGPVPPNAIFLAVARSLLPAWLVGVVMAAAALSGLVVLSGICLALGSLVSRNLLPGLDDGGQRRWARLVMAVFLLVSAAGADAATQLMVTINNLYYVGMTQIFPGVLAILVLPRVSAAGVACGLLCGDAVGIALFETGTNAGGLHPGVAGLAVNLAILCLQARLRPARDLRPIARPPANA